MLLLIFTNKITACHWCWDQMKGTPLPKSLTLGIVENCNFLMVEIKIC